MNIYALLDQAIKDQQHGLNRPPDTNHPYSVIQTIKFAHSAKLLPLDLLLELVQLSSWCAELASIDEDDIWKNHHYGLNTDYFALPHYHIGDAACEELQGMMNVAFKAFNEVIDKLENFTPNTGE